MIGSLATLALTDLVALVNRADVGYPGPFSPEEPGDYSAFCRAQNVDFARSVLARDAAGAPVGFGLLGLRGAHGWCGEFGVVPAWRRQGLGRALLAALLDQARVAGCRTVQLEVAAANRPAQRLYEAGGFCLRRVLHNYTAAPSVLGRHSDPAPAASTVATADPSALLLPPCAPEPPPAWDHELPALLAEGGQTLRATGDGHPCGLLHYVAADPRAIQIRRLSVPPGDHATARALLAAAVTPATTRLVVAYVAEASPLYRLLPQLGFQELAADWEMVCEL